jgi:putative membrane protein
MFTDWILACLHHVAVFSLAAVIAAELALISVEISATSIRRLAAIDLWYGILAGAVIAFGIARLIWGAKGYEYYLANHIFWTKMALFLAVGLLSIAPTLRYLAWGRKLKAEPAFVPEAAEVARVRTFVWLEAALFLCIPIAAAAMARGYGI